MKQEPFPTLDSARLPQPPGATRSAGYDRRDIVASRHRCLDQYRLNQGSNAIPDVLTVGEFHRVFEPVEGMLAHLREELDGLSAIVCPLGYATLIADANGIIMDMSAIDSASSKFKRNGTRIGGIWSEQSEGTNGIGTCLYTGQPLTVHRDQHFRTRHSKFSCSGAPIFDWQGSVILVLCLADCGHHLAGHAYAMTLAIAVAWARMIEERLFREHFSSYWTLAIEPGDGASPGLLLAVDTDQRIVGADRLARLRFAIADHDINAGISLWSRFERAPSTCKWIKFGDDTPIHLDCSADASHWHGIATPPAGRLHRVPSAISARLHTRPRLGMLHSLPKAEPTPMVRGGLSSAVCRRVLAYIENNLHTPIHVDELAWQAGLSIHHFTREFSRTVGEAPHAYLLRRRLEKSAEMIENTDRPLAEIALATGFSDQSHFTRRFTRHVGMTPGAFRRARRDDQGA